MAGWGRGTWGSGPWGRPASVSTTVAADTATATVDAPTPSVDTAVGTTMVADTTTATAVAPTPSVAIEVGPIVAAPETTVTTTAPTPTVAGDKHVSITATAPLATATASPAPTVSTTMTVTATPPTATATVEMLKPSVVTGDGVGIGATSATATVTAPPPTVSSAITATAVADTATATTTAPTPSMYVGPRLGAPTATATTTAPPPSISTVVSTTVDAGAADATVTAPAPSVATSTQTAVTAPTTTATTSAPAPTVETAIGAPIEVDAAVSVVTLSSPTVASHQSTVVVAGEATATTTAPPAVVSVDLNGRAVAPTATATVSTGFAAPNPSRTTITVDSTTATVSTPVPTVAERVPARVAPEPPSLTVTAEPTRVEAVSPIATLPGAIECLGMTAETSAALSPDIDVGDVPDTEPVPANKHYRETVSPDRPEFAQPQQRTVRAEEESVYTPDRRLYINDREFNVDRDVFVSAGEYGFTLADCTLYNLDVETWAWISRQDRLRVELGWQQGDRQLVFDGAVNIKRRRERRHNRAYVIRGREEGAEILTSRYSRSYTNMSPHRIVDHLIADIDGLDRGYIATGSSRIEGTYSISSSRELNDWLDRLAKKATRQTGERWVWYIDRGEISFHPSAEQATEPIELSMDKSVVRVTPAGLIGDEPSLQRYELVARCEPIIRRGLAVSVAGANAIDEGTQYRVVEYSHESTTTTGRHHTTAVLEPMRTESTYPQL